MTPFHADSWLTVYQGDALTVLRELPERSVHCVITSPPYWGLRDYGVPGQLGLEPTPEEYVANMVAVFREVRRVLRDDGTLWLNMGDCYATGAGSYRNPGSDVAPIEHGGKQAFTRDYARAQPNRMPLPGLKPKDLIGMPWRLAFALQADGWVLRADVVWNKPNPMPESVMDRPTKAHEMLFLLSKGKRIGPEPTRYDDIADGDARWLAALLDGEGSIVIRREQPTETGQQHAAQVSIGSTSRALLERVAAIVGEGTVLEREGQNAPMHYWQTGGKRALGLLRRLYPFLIVKQRQARCAIALEERKWVRGGHKRLSDAEVAWRERVWEAVKSLNHFGDPDLSGVPEPIFGHWTAQPYYYDAEAVREPNVSPEQLAHNLRYAKPYAAYDERTGPDGTGQPGNTNNTGIHARPGGAGRNLRSVWTIATEPYPGAHFATFPQKLVEPCIKAGTSEKGVCPECGAPWVRVMRAQYDTVGRTTNGPRSTDNRAITAGFEVRALKSVETTGWRPSCRHGIIASESAKRDCVRDWFGHEELWRVWEAHARQARPPEPQAVLLGGVRADLLEGSAPKSDDGVQARPATPQLPGPTDEQGLRDDPSADSSDGKRGGLRGRASASDGGEDGRALPAADANRPSPERHQGRQQAGEPSGPTAPGPQPGSAHSGDPGATAQSRDGAGSPERFLIPLPPSQAVCLDPFAGTGTVGLVAQRLSRRAILIDLSTEYMGQLLQRNRQMPVGLLG